MKAFLSHLSNVLAQPDIDDTVLYCAPLLAIIPQLRYLPPTCGQALSQSLAGKPALRFQRRRLVRLATSCMATPISMTRACSILLDRSLKKNTAVRGASHCGPINCATAGISALQSRSHVSPPSMCNHPASIYWAKVVSNIRASRLSLAGHYLAIDPYFHSKICTLEPFGGSYFLKCLATCATW